MRLINPLTGLPVDAEGENARLLMERGFKPETPAKKRPQRRNQDKTRATRRG